MYDGIIHRIIHRIICICIMIFVCTSCDYNKSRVKSDLEHFIQQNILIPKNMICINCVDSLINKSPETKSLKYVIYIDESLCKECVIKQLDRYKDIYDDPNVELIIIFSQSSTEIQSLMSILKNSNLTVPIYIDYNQEFELLNKDMPDDYRFHYFLMDFDGRPLFVGDPTSSQRLKNLFQKVVQKYSS